MIKKGRIQNERPGPIYKNSVYASKNIMLRLYSISTEMYIKKNKNEKTC